MSPTTNTTDPPPYGTPADPRGPILHTYGEEEILVAAREIIRSRWPKDRKQISDAAGAFAALEIHYGNAPRETVALLLLDSGNRLIAIVDLATGTVDGSAVYMREVIRAVIAHDATGVILAHNHPSGRTNPSEADRQLTAKVRAALRAIDVRLLDHVVCGAGEFYSFADHRENSFL